MGCSDKMMFLIKDMVANLTHSYKKTLNPFIVAHLDMFTVKNFEFPHMGKELFVRSQKLDVNFNRNFIETQLSSNSKGNRFFPKLREDERKVNVPSMMHLFCNLLEVLRYRENLIQAMSETVVLGEVFDSLKSMVNRDSLKHNFADQLHLDAHKVGKEAINWMEDGVMLDEDIALAINEFDASFKNHMDFMNSESF